MTTQTVLSDDWSYEPAEPDVGIFSHGWIHETCEADYVEGVTDSSHLQGLPDDRGYVDESTTLTCLDCGATVEFVHPEFVGFDI